MGCDIHTYAETRTMHLRDRVAWEYTGPYWNNEQYKELDPPSVYNSKLSPHPYMHRNYILFSMLADVRNDGRVEPIDKARGLPKDVSEEIRELSDQWGLDGHSRSWLTVEELLKARNTPQYMIHEYYFDAKQYTQYLSKDINSIKGRFFTLDKPEWITRDEMKKRILLDTCTGNEATVVHEREEINAQLDQVINPLNELLRYVDNDPKRIRMIFWFDN